jgi:DNA-binding response OmpR family regulator
MNPILVVDDEFDLLETVRSILEAEGYFVIASENGARALEVMRRETPALVLLDIMMPGLDGFTTLAKIRSEPAWDEVPVILMSAVRPSIAERGLRVDGFLEKPFALAALLALVERHIGKPERRRDTG